MRIDDLDSGTVTPPQYATSISIPTALAKAIYEEVQASSCTMLAPVPCDRGMGTSDVSEWLSPRLADLRVPTNLDTLRTTNTHDQTLRATRVRKVPESSSASGADTAFPERTKNMAKNTAAIKHWSSSAKVCPLFCLYYLYTRKVKLRG